MKVENQTFGLNERFSELQKNQARKLFSVGFGHEARTGRGHFEEYLQSIGRVPTRSNLWTHNLLVLVDPSLGLAASCELFGIDNDTKSAQLVDMCAPPKQPYWLWANNGGHNCRYSLQDATERLQPNERLLSALEGLFLAAQHPASFGTFSIMLGGTRVSENPELVLTLERFGKKPKLHAAKRKGAYTNCGAATCLK